MTHRKTSISGFRLPAWIGSVLFHLIVLAVVLFFFYLRPVPASAPGDRNASGGIVMKQESEEGRSYTDSENTLYGEASPQIADEQPKAPTLEEMLSAEFSEADLKNVLPNPAIGRRAASGTAQNVPGAAAMAEALEGGSSNAGLGRDPGGKVGVNVFGAEGKGTTFVYVFDRSGSMNEFAGRPIRAAKTELIKSLAPLDKFHKFNVIFYNEKSLPWNPGKMLFATDVNKANATKFIEGIIPMGGTRHREPLVDAIRMRPEVIFFLTDGDENDALSPGQLEDITRLNSNIGAGAQINVIQFGAGEKREANFLRNLAARNRGQYVYVNVAGLR